MSKWREREGGSTAKASSARPDGSSRISFWTTRRAVYLSAALLIAAILSAYHNSFRVPFIMDDKPSIVDNPTIRHLWPIRGALMPPGGATTVSGRPVANLSFALNYAFGGDRVLGYHVVNTTIHILAALALLGVARRTLSRAGPAFGEMATPMALATALLWALHPLQTEAVTYVAQRTESLMGLFYLLTFYCFIRGAISISNLKSQIPNLWNVLCVGACWLGMGCKEVMVSAPLLVLLYDRALVAGTFGAALQKRRWLYAGLASAWLLLAFDYGGQKSSLNATISTGSYLLTQCWAIGRYLRLAAWPHPLVFDYGKLIVRGAAEVTPGALLISALAIATVAGLLYRPALGFLGCWFFAILAPTSSILPLGGQTVAEHRMYLPLAAVIIAAILGIYRLAGRWSMMLFLALAVAWGSMTARRNEDYRSELSLWTDTVIKRGDNERAQNNLGGVLERLGRVDEAMAHIAEALALGPEDPGAHYNMGNVLLKKGWQADAIGQFEQVLALKPGSATVQNDLAWVLATSPDASIRDGPRALQLAQRANEISGGSNSMILSTLAAAYAEAGNYSEAVTAAQRGLDLIMAQTNLPLGAVLRDQIRLHQAGSPYRDASLTNAAALRAAH